MAQIGRVAARWRFRWIAGTCVLAAGTIAAPGLAAQAPTVGDAPRSFHTIGSRAAIGHDLHVPRDEEVRNGLFVIGGNLRVDGRVRDDVIVVGGDLALGPAADVGGDVTLVGGLLRRAPGARLTGSVNHVSFGDWRWRDGWARWTGFPDVDGARLWPWLGLAATTTRLALLALVMVALLLVARAPVARVGRAAAAEPGRAFLVGLAAEVLFVPVLAIVSAVLVVTIIGIPLVAVLVPLAVLAGLVALVLGFTGLACRLGERIEDGLGWRMPSALVATALGVAVLVGPVYVARLLDVATPSLGAVAFSLFVAGALVEYGAWTIGLGASLMTGFGRRPIAVGSSLDT